MFTMALEIFGTGTELWVSAYVLTAFLSASAFLGLKNYWSEVPFKFNLIHFFVVTWSGIIYLNFLGSSPLNDFTWYADWIISTPLILLALGLTAMKDIETRWDLIFAVTGLQFMLVVTGAISQLTGSTYAFWIGCGLLLGVIYILWKPFRDMAYKTSETLGRSYSLLAGYISVLFVLYPVIWYIGSPGPLNMLNTGQTSIAFVVLPFLCKQLYGFLDLYLIQRYETGN